MIELAERVTQLSTTTLLAWHIGLTLASYGRCSALNRTDLDRLARASSYLKSVLAGFRLAHPTGTIISIGETEELRQIGDFRLAEEAYQEVGVVLTEQELVGLNDQLSRLAAGTLGLTEIGQIGRFFRTIGRYARRQLCCV